MIISIMWKSRERDTKAGAGYSPIPIRRHYIVNPKLLTDLFNTKMQGIRLELLVGEVRHNHGRQAHQASGLVLLGITPTITLLASLRAILKWFS